MGLRLADAKDTGDLDTVSYRDIRISNINWNLAGNIIEVIYQLGNFNDTTGYWKAGILKPRSYLIDDSAPNFDYSTVFHETYKRGNDTVPERYVEICTNLLALRLGLDGAYQKPGKSGKKRL